MIVDWFSSLDRFLSIVGKSDKCPFRVIDLVLGKDPVLSVPDVSFALHVRTDPDQIIRPFGSYENDLRASARGQQKGRGYDQEQAGHRLLSCLP